MFWEVENVIVRICFFSFVTVFKILSPNLNKEKKKQTIPHSRIHHPVLSTMMQRSPSGLILLIRNPFVPQCSTSESNDVSNGHSLPLLIIRIEHPIVLVVFSLHQYEIFLYCIFLWQLKLISKLLLCQ